MSAADPEVTASLEQLGRARLVVATAHRFDHISDDEREYFASTFDPEPGPPLALVCCMVSDLRLLAPRESMLFRVAGEFLDSAPPTRGGIFLYLDMNNEPVSPLAEASTVIVARRLVDQALELKIINASEHAMLLEQLTGEAVTEAAVQTVRAQLDARGRNARKAAKK